MSASTYYDHTDPTTALRTSQRASSVLSKSSLIPTSLPWSIVSVAETPEEWAELEQTFYACLRAQDDKSAYLCLERLIKRFGAVNERVIAMRGLYQEATAKDEVELRQILQEYNKILEATPMNVPVHKRRIALIRSMGKFQEATASLVEFLESFPTDTEAWCELSDLYQSQGLSSQAIYSLQEALLTVPNAWNLQARLGELNLLAGQSTAESGEVTVQLLEEAIRRFSRSIELCDDYLRGYYGLKLATDRLIRVGSSNKNSPKLPVDKLKKLNDMATQKLESFVQQWSTKKTIKADESEVIAAQALLNRSS